MTESTRKCQRAKKIGTEISNFGAFVVLSKLFFTILSCELSFALSRIPSRFFEPSLNLSRPAKNLSRHNTTLNMITYIYIILIYYLKTYIIYISIIT